MFNFRRTKETDPLSSIFEVALGESPTEARRLSQSWHEQRSLSRSLWHECATVSLQTSLDRCDKIILQEQEILQHFLCSSQCGTVLLTIHMGDYIHSILKILAIAQGKRVVLLRKKTRTEAEQAVFQKLELLGHNLTTVRHGPTAAKTIASALRQGAIVVLLYDLSSRWGETSPVKLFNTELNWVAGPLYLAMLGRGNVIPFYTYQENGRCVCEVESILDYTKKKVVGSNDRAAFLTSENQKIAALAEKHIRQHAPQWNHWHLVPEMASVQVRDNDS